MASSGIAATFVKPVEVKSPAPELTANLESITRDAMAFYEQVRNQNVDWSQLNWSANGPAALFEQFKVAGGWADYITGKMLDFEAEKNVVIGLFENFRTSIEKDYEAALKRGSKGFITSGYAWQERSAFARMDSPGSWAIAVFDKRLENLNNTLALLKAKAKMFSDFKGDAKVAASLLNFGHVLQEFK